MVSFHSKVRGTAGMHRTRFKELLMQAAQNIGLERLYRLSELLLVTQICLHRLRKCHGKLFNFKELFFFFNKISYYFNYLTLQYCICFAIYQHESTTGIHVFTVLNPPPFSLPVPSLWVVPLHQPQASSIMHRIWTGNSFHDIDIET